MQSLARDKKKQIEQKSLFCDKVRNYEERELESGMLQPNDLKTHILGLLSRNGNRGRVENVTQTVTEGIDHESLDPRLREWLKEHHNSPHFLLD